jgi:uncharacterized protein (DUF1697 family)
MHTYVILIRGINVGGKNTISMGELKACLEKLGCTNVITYINSGNVLVTSDKSPTLLKSLIEDALPKNFKLDSELIKIHVLTREQLSAVVKNKPKGFGEEPKKYYSDAIFLIDCSVEDAMSVFKPKEGVDKIWPGNGVIYSQRLGELRTKSNLSRIVGTSVYKSMTIRNWNTTTKLLKMLEELDG